MAYTSIPGGLWQPGIFPNPLTSSATAIIQATGQKVALIGHVKCRAAVTIVGVGFRFGTVVKAGGSALTVSLQDVVSTAILEPDGTQDQTVAIANANASFASNTWIQNTLGSSRTVNPGDLVCVVIEFDGAGRLGSDTAVIQSWSMGGQLLNQTMAVLFTSSWATLATVPTVVFELSDGSFTTFDGGSFHSTTQSSAFSSSSSPDERAMKFQVPFLCKIDAFNVSNLTIPSGASCDIVLYDSDGTTALATYSIDAAKQAVQNSSKQFICPITPVVLQAATSYYLAVKPATTTNVTFVQLLLNASGHGQASWGGANWLSSSRTDAGSWTDLATVVPLIGIRISDIDFSSGGGVVARVIGG